MRRRELPGARVVLIVSFGPSMDVDGRRFTSFVAGLHEAPALTEHAGEGYGMEAYLTPLGARRLLGVPMSELTGRVVELEDLLGRGAGELAERLAEAPGWAARFALLEREIARRVLDAPAALRARRRAPARRSRPRGPRARLRLLRPGALQPRLPGLHRHHAYRVPAGHIRPRLHVDRRVASRP